MGYAKKKSPDAKAGAKQEQGWSKTGGSKVKERQEQGKRVPNNKSSNKNYCQNKAPGDMVGFLYPPLKVLWLSFGSPGSHCPPVRTS